ncbi:MAG: metallophosphoesterase [Mycoplasmatales bacterium]
MKKSIYISIFVFLSLILFISIGLKEGDKVIKKTYNVESNKISQNYTIVQLSDFHSMNDQDRIEEINKIISTEKIDLFAITGDFIDEADYTDELEYLVTLKNIAPVYYTNGNHDNDGGQYSAFIEDLEANEIYVVADDHALFNEEINIIGIETKFTSTLKKLDSNDAYYNQVLVNDSITFDNYISDDLFNLVLAHNPAFFEGYCDYKVDLVLTGHTHGGLWRLPFLNISAIAPEQGIFPEYDAGIFECNDDKTKMIISSGLERISNGIRRFYNPSEIVVVQLKSIK